MLHQINFPAKRAALMSQLHEAEDARRVASLAQLAGKGSAETLTKCRDTVAKIKEQLADIEAAETLAGEQADKQAELDQLARRAKAARSISENFDLRRKSAKLVDDALAVVTSEMQKIATYEDAIASEAIDWANKAGGNFSANYGYSELLIGSFHENARHMHIESVLNAANIMTSGRFDAQLHRDTKSIGHIVEDGEPRSRGFVARSIPELREAEA